MVTDPEKLGVGARIRRWRTHRGLSQKELAERAGLAAGSIVYRYESNRILPGVETLAHLADALNVPIDSLVRDAPRDLPPAPQDVERFIERLVRHTENERRPAIAAACAVLDTLQG